MNNKTIQIVEDDGILAAHLQSMLTRLGYHPLPPVATGEAAIAAATQNRPDIILMDIQLADNINGIAAAIQIQSSAHIPVIFLTAFSQENLLQEARAAAPYGYLIKPVLERELAATISMALNRHALYQELQESQTALAESEANYRTLFEQSPLGIFRTTLSGKALLVNAEMARIVGCDTPEEALANFTDLSCQLYVNPERRQEFIRRLQAHGEVNRFEYQGKRKNGDVVWISMSAKLRHDIVGNEPVIDGFAVDITEAKQMEEDRQKLESQIQQTQKLESLGVLAGGIAHDFNNILMAVLGHAELALSEISPMSAARDSILQIATASRRAADLCRQMLAYSGRATFTLEQVALCELIEEMLHLLRTSITKKAVLNLNMEHHLPFIKADPSQIRQLVMNLIINASDAIGTRSGVITISAGATRCDEDYLSKTELYEELTPGLYVHLEVTDTGCGMDAETRSRIFEPFFTTKFTGRGLGLAAAIGIVRAHKGALKVYSEPGRGTTFKVLFPAMEEAQDQAPADNKTLAPWHGKGTVLLADDEESLRALGARMLEMLGFTVLTASDGREALGIYQKRWKEIDLVLLDLTMPHMDGAQTFGELRRINPDVQVILVSGYSQEDVAARFAGKRLAGVLQKPYPLSNLQELLKGLNFLQKSE